MPAAKLLIFTAMQMEAKPIIRSMHLDVCSDTQATGSAHDEMPVELHVIGVLGKRMPALASVGAARAVILAGLAGGLDPGLRCGDVVLDDPSRIVPSDCAPGIRRASIYGADRIIANADEKATLFRSSGCVAVDMESAIVRRAVDSITVPFLNIRGIVDAAADPLDPATASLLDENGHLKLSAAVSLLARRPALIPEMLRTRAKALGALHAMARAVEAVIRGAFTGNSAEKIRVAR